MRPWQNLAPAAAHAMNAKKGATCIHGTAAVDFGPDGQERVGAQIYFLCFARTTRETDRNFHAVEREAINY